MPALLLSSCKILDKLLNLFMPQFLKKCANKAKEFMLKRQLSCDHGTKREGWMWTSSNAESTGEIRWQGEKRDEKIRENSRDSKKKKATNYMWIKERVKKQKLFQSLLFERDGRAWHQVTTWKGKGGGMSNPRLKWVGTRTQTTWFESPGVPGLTEASLWQMTKSGCLLIVCQSWNHGE